MLTTEAEGTAFGAVVAGIGDINGDGFDDVAVGAPAWSDEVLAQAGQVSIYLGSADGLDPTPIRLLTGGASGDRLGSTIVGVGDLTGDGFDDVAIAVPYADVEGMGDVGVVHLYAGSASGIGAAPYLTLQGSSPSEWFGTSIDGGDDIDGEGTPDLVIGAPGYDSQRGRVHVYLGTAGTLPSTPVQALEGSTYGELFGQRILVVEDMHGDGKMDLVVSAPHRASDTSSLAGQVFVFPGTISGLSTAAVSSLSAGTHGPERMGWQLLSDGDIDGDGFGDVLASGPYASKGGVSNVGRLAMFRGANTGPVEETAASVYGWTQDEQMGLSMALVGDMDGDGVAEFAVAAPTYDGIRDNSGRIDIFNIQTLPFAPVRSLEGPSVGVQLGTALAGAGDVNGDGFMDLLASTLDTTGMPGEVWVLYGTDDETVDEANPDDSGNIDDSGTNTDTVSGDPSRVAVDLQTSTSSSCSTLAGGTGPWPLALLGLLGLTRRRRRASWAGAALLVTFLCSATAEAKSEPDGITGLYISGIRYSGDGLVGARGLHTLRTNLAVRAGDRPLMLGLDVAMAGSQWTRTQFTPQTTPTSAQNDKMVGDCWFDTCAAYASHETVNVTHLPVGLTATWIHSVGPVHLQAGGGPALHFFRASGNAAVSMADAAGGDADGMRTWAGATASAPVRGRTIGARLVAASAVEIGDLPGNAGSWGLSLQGTWDLAISKYTILSAPLTASRYYDTGKRDLEATPVDAQWQRPVNLNGSNLSYGIGLVWFK